MNIWILILVSIATFCNRVHIQNLNRYKEINLGLETQGDERTWVNFCRLGLFIVVLLDAFCTKAWWPGVLGYVIGAIIALPITDEEIEAYIIFFGKFITPIAIISAGIIILI